MLLKRPYFLLVLVMLACSIPLALSVPPSPPPIPADPTFMMNETNTTDTNNTGNTNTDDNNQGSSSNHHRGSSRSSSSITLPSNLAQERNDTIAETEDTSQEITVVYADANGSSSNQTGGKLNRISGNVVGADVAISMDNDVPYTDRTMMGNLIHSENGFVIIFLAVVLLVVIISVSMVFFNRHRY